MSEIKHILSAIKESVYQNKDINKLIQEYYRKADLYGKNILASLKKEGLSKEQILENIQTTLNIIDKTPELVAAHLQSVLPSKAVIGITNITPFLMKLLCSMKSGYTFYVSTNIPYSARNVLSRKGKLYTFENFMNILHETDALLISCNSFNQTAIAVDQTEIEMADKHHCPFIITTTNHYSQKKGTINTALKTAKIITEKGVFSHKSLVEELTVNPPEFL